MIKAEVLENKQKVVFLNYQNKIKLRDKNE